MKDVEGRRFFDVTYNCLLLAESTRLVLVFNVCTAELNNTLAND